jgi:hypothetical protein
MLYPEALQDMAHKPIGFVYVLKDWSLVDTYKIGITTRKIQQRLKEINQCLSSAVKLEYLSPATERYKLVEKKLHRLFKSSNTFTGLNASLSEWFYLPPEQYKILRLVLSYEFAI